MRRRDLIIASSLAWFVCFLILLLGSITNLSVGSLV